MSKQVGALIKEARTAAGMSQKDLANAVEGVSASVISKVERGEKALTPEQLKAVAEALGVAPESLCEACPVEEAAAEEAAPDALTSEEKELLASYRAANADTQKAAVSALKGEKPQAPNMMDMLAGMMGGGGEGGENPMAGMMGGLMGMMGGGEGGNPLAGMMGGGEGGENPMAGMMSGLMGMMGGGSQKKDEEKPSEEPEK